MKFKMIILLVTGIFMTQGLAKESQGNKEQTARTETHALDKKIAMLEAEIEVLESKGKQNLTKEDKIKRYHLKKQLLAAQKEKTGKQREIIEFKQKELLKSYENINKKLGSINATLSSGNDKK